jgi:ABC-2 type transport system ATP-binding protein
VAVRLPEGVSDLAEIVRALDAEDLRIADLRLHSPTLDDVFLAKTGRSLEGASDNGTDEGTGTGDGVTPNPGADAATADGATAGR